MLTKPFASQTEKENHVCLVFRAIAHKYDLMNTVLSFNQDKYWRRFAAGKTGLKPGGKGLDVCCGTGRLTLQLAKMVGREGTVTGIDFCEEMLSVGRADIANTPYSPVINLMAGNAMHLPFADNAFDAVTNAFALRNVPDIEGAVREMRRVVRPGGRVVALDLAKPSATFFKQLYYFYFEKVLPWLGSRSIGAEGPYQWLPESLRQFPHQAEICKIFTRAGLKNVWCHELTGGIVAVYVGEKL